MKKGKRILAIITCILLIMLNICPISVIAKTDEEEKLDWDALINDPRYTVKADYGMYRYDTEKGKMVKCNLNDRKNTSEVTPLTISLYDNSTGELVACQYFLPTFDFNKDNYLNTVPLGSQYTDWYYERFLYSEDGLRIIGDMRGDGTISKTENFYESDLEERAIHEGYHADERIDYGHKYGYAGWKLEYWFDVKIVSPAYWPVEYMENTGGVVRDSDKDYYEFLVRERQNEEKRGFQYYETNLAGRRTLVRENAWSGEEHYETTMYLDDDYIDIPYTYSDNGYYTRYYVVNEMPDIPGFYAVIQIVIGDSYSLKTADAYGSTPTEVLQLNSDYNYYKPIITEQILNDLAAMNIGGTLTSEVFTDTITQESSTTALEESGEDEGTELYDDIVDGKKPYEKDKEKVKEKDNYDPMPKGMTPGDVAGAVASGAVAVGIAGLLNSNGKGEGDKEDKKKKGKYKMYVQKDFGNAIRKGDPPVIVRARMVEVDEHGKENDRNDLTQKIQATCLGLSLKGTNVVGRYLEATVFASQDTNDENGSITFHLTGSGGVFSNKVIFRMIGEPYIAFPALTEDGTAWDLTTNLDEVSMVAGMGGQDSIRFLIQDAFEEPKKITFLDADGFSILPDKDTTKAYTYYAKITNQTEKMEKESDIFASLEERKITVCAEFSDGRIAKGSFCLKLYSDGISVEADKKKIVKGSLQINTEPDDNAKEGMAEISPVRFSVMVCYVDAGGKAIIQKNPTLKFEPLEDDGKYANTFKEQFKYKIIDLGEAGFDFAPKCTLPMIKTPYEVKMGIKYSKEVMLFGELPISFLGMRPLPPSQAEKEEAIIRLKKTITYYGLSGEDAQLTALVRNARNHSAAEIEYIRYQVLIAAVKYYREEGEEYTRIGNVFDRYVVIAGGLVTAGDYAIEVILSRCLGSAGKVTAKFVNPLKNMLAKAIGEYIANDKEFSEEEFWKAYRTGIYDVIEESLDSVNPSPEKIGYVTAGYLMLMFTKHYYDGDGKEKGDVYRSIIAAFYDLKFAQFKEWLGKLISKGTGKIWEKVQKWFSDSFQKKLTENMQKVVSSTKMKEFVSQVRDAYKKDGKLTNAEYALIKESQKVTATLQMEQLKRGMPGYVDKATDEAMDLLQLSLGQVINFFLGGKGDGSEGWGVTPDDIIQEYLCDKISSCLEGRIDSVNDLLEKAMPGIYFSNGVMTVSCFDESYDVNLMELAQKIIDTVFDYCFSWMEDLWKVDMPDQNSLPDKRDEISEDTDQLDKQQARLDGVTV